MKVFDLICPHGHAFEGWFASEADYSGQQERGFLTCPVCDAGGIERRPSAPRLNLGQPTRPAAEEPDRPTEAPETRSLTTSALKALVHEVVEQVLARTEDVGERFASEARAIHRGEAPERGIRGEATAAERDALADEGIAFMSLPLPRRTTH